MRVALVSEYYYPDVGGMPEHVHNLAAELGRRGHEVVIVTTEFPDVGLADPPPPPCEVVRLGRSCRPLIENGSVSRAAVGFGLRPRLMALFAQRRFDIVHVHAPIFPTLSLLAIACAPPGSRTVGTLHTHFSDSRVLRLFRRPLQRYLDALDGLITVSESALRSMRKVGFRLAAEEIPNGVSLSYWQSGTRLPRYDDGRINLLVQARLEPRNHIKTIVAALSRLREGPPLRLLVVGDGPLREELGRAAAGLCVELLGAQGEARRDFAKTADIYCFSAAIASHPMALLEGMAAGLPILAHDIEGVRELVADGREGFVLPLADPSAYAAALHRLATAVELRKRLGAAALRRAAAFDWPRIAARIEAFYEAVLSRPHATSPNFVAPQAPEPA